jgi:hypothetical protein
MTLRDVWDRQADQWTRFVRDPAGGVAKPVYNLPWFLELVAEPGPRPPAGQRRRLPIQDRIPLFLMWRAAKL